MTAPKSAQELWPDAFDDEINVFFRIGQYQPIIDSFGKVVCQQSYTDGTFGETWVVYKDDAGVYDYLHIQWGVEDNFDPLASADGYEEINHIIENLWNSRIHFLSVHDLYAYIRDEVDYYTETKGYKDFILKVNDYLKKEDNYIQNMIENVMEEYRKSKKDAPTRYFENHVMWKNNNNNLD